jgi:hypothetical protein
MIDPVRRSEIIHASCVAIGAGDAGRAVLIVGRSGAGKSDLALRLIDRGATLVSDDYTVVQRVEGRLIASAPATIAGRIEVRGLGILRFPTRPEAPVALLVMLGEAVPRLPDQPWPSRPIAGLSVPVIALAGLEASAPLKVELALRAIEEEGLLA